MLTLKFFHMDPMHEYMMRWCVPFYPETDDDSDDDYVREKPRTLKFVLNDDDIAMDYVFKYYYCHPTKCKTHIYFKNLMACECHLVKTFAKLGLPTEIALEIHKHLVECADNIFKEHLALVEHRSFVLLPAIRNFARLRTKCRTIKDALSWGYKNRRTPYDPSYLLYESWR